MYQYWVSTSKGLRAQVLLQTFQRADGDTSYTLWDPQNHSDNPILGTWLIFPEEHYREISKDQFDAMLSLTVTSRK